MAELYPRDTEEAVLGTLLLHPELYRQVENLLVPSDFSHEATRATFEKMTACWAEEGMFNVQLLAERGVAMDAMNRLMDAMPAVSLLGRNVEVLTEAGTLRRLAERLAWIGHNIREGLTTVHQARDELTSAVEQVERAGLTTPTKSFTTWQRELDENPPEWIIRGVIREAERVLFVGPEGMGKSTLNWQIAMGAATGIHPFKSSDTGNEQHVVLVVDAENAGYSPREDGILAPASPGGIAAMLKHNYPDLGVEELLERNLHVWPDMAIDLRSAGYQRRMDAAMRHVHPKLVILGPVYRIWPKDGDDDWDEQAQSFQRYVDSLRKRFGSAFWIEHHAPKASANQRFIQSYGSSFWERWPDVGRGAVPLDVARGDSGYGATSYKLGLMRGDRTKRGAAFPDAITRGRPGRDWPWVPRVI